MILCMFVCVCVCVCVGMVLLDPAFVLGRMIQFSQNSEFFKSYSNSAIIRTALICECDLVGGRRCT